MRSQVDLVVAQGTMGSTGMEKRSEKSSQDSSLRVGHGGGCFI